MHTSSGQDAKRKKEGGPLLEMFFFFLFFFAASRLLRVPHRDRLDLDRDRFRVFCFATAYQK